MTITYDPIGEELAKLSPKDQEAIKLASEQWHELSAGAHLQQWLKLQPGLVVLRRTAERLSNSNRPIGIRYTEQFRLLLDRAGFGGLQPQEQQRQTDQITDLLWLAEPLQPREPETRTERLNRLLQAMTPLERARLTLPTAARAKVTKSFREEREAKQRAAEAAARAKQGLPPLSDSDADNEKPLSKLKQTEQALAKALQENHRLTEQLKRKDDGSLFDLRLSPAKEIASAIAPNCSETKWREIKRETDEAYKRKRARPAG